MIFFIGFELNRNSVYDYILNEIKLLCDYDPCIYQGVLIKFYWNNMKSSQDGRCTCKKMDVTEKELVMEMVNAKKLLYLYFKVVILL